MRIVAISQKRPFIPRLFASRITQAPTIEANGETDQVADIHLGLSRAAAPKSPDGLVDAVHKASLSIRTPVSAERCTLACMITPTMDIGQPAPASADMKWMFGMTVVEAALFIRSNVMYR